MLPVVISCPDLWGSTLQQSFQPGPGPRYPLQSEQRKGIYQEDYATPLPYLKLAIEAECGCCASLLYGRKVVPGCLPTIFQSGIHCTMAELKDGGGSRGLLYIFLFSESERQISPHFSECKIIGRTKFHL